jgi:uncharacterized alkaline shock family protein YloU
VPDRPIPGRSLLTRRAVTDVVRTAVLSCYGVTGFATGRLGGLRARFGSRQPGLMVRWGDGGSIDIGLDITVALGVPVAEVARQVDSAVRYALAHALDRRVGRIVIHVDGLRVNPAVPMSIDQPVRPAQIRPHELADSGSDVA